MPLLQNELEKRVKIIKIFIIAQFIFALTGSALVGLPFPEESRAGAVLLLAVPTISVMLTGMLVAWEIEKRYSLKFQKRR